MITGAGTDIDDDHVSFQLVKFPNEAFFLA